VSILEIDMRNTGKRLFLLSLHFFLDKNPVNERATLPRVYAQLVPIQGASLSSIFAFQCSSRIHFSEEDLRRQLRIQF